MEDYPSLAEGNGLENRQVGATRRESSNLSSSFKIGLSRDGAVW